MNGFPTNRIPVLATQEHSKGYRIIFQTGNVFGCHRASETASSTAILQAHSIKISWWIVNGPTQGYECSLKYKLKLREVPRLPSFSFFKKKRKKVKIKSSFQCNTERKYQTGNQKIHCHALVLESIKFLEQLCSLRLLISITAKCKN